MTASTHTLWPSLWSWIRAARPVAHGMIALPLLWGQALALLLTQQFDWLWFVVCHLFGVLCQIFVLYLNDYADESLDRRNENYWLSGGSRVIPDGQLTGRQLYRAALLCLALMLLLSATAFACGRAWMPVLVVAALALGWSYSLPPLQTSYRGYGELHQAISCGVLLPIIGYYLQTNGIAYFPWFCLLPVALTFFASNIVTALPDIESDTQGGKRTYPVRHGPAAARKQVLRLSMMACVLVIAADVMLSNNQWGSLWAAGPSLFAVVLAGKQGSLKRFMILTMSSHGWLLTAWTALLLWRGVDSS